MTQEAERSEPGPDAARSRHKTMGRNVATLAYNKLVTEMQAQAPNLDRALALSRLVDAGCRIEAQAEALPLSDLENADAALARGVAALGLEVPVSDQP